MNSLVIYNAGDPNNWKYGPEHVFKVEVQGNATVANMSEMHSNVTMYIPCRPLNTKLIHCHVESATIDNYEIPHDTKIPYRPEPPGVFEIGDIMFQVEFNENGVSMVKFANTNDSYRTTMIRSVVDNLNLAINIMNLKNKNSTVGIEKSNMGICHTKYFMHKDTLSTKPDMETILDRSINLKVAMRGENSADAINNDGETMIVIEKIRQSCGKKSPYFFGHDVDDMKKHNGIRMKTELVRIICIKQFLS